MKPWAGSSLGGGCAVCCEMNETLEPAACSYRRREGAAAPRGTWEPLLMWTEIAEQGCRCARKQVGKRWRPCGWLGGGPVGSRQRQVAAWVRHGQVTWQWWVGSDGDLTAGARWWCGRHWLSSMVTRKRPADHRRHGVTSVYLGSCCASTRCVCRCKSDHRPPELRSYHWQWPTVHDRHVAACHTGGPPVVGGKYSVIPHYKCSYNRVLFFKV
jgi:hypothetical protein